MSIDKIAKLAHPENWQISLQDYFFPREAVAIFLHPFYQLPQEQTPEEYSCELDWIERKGYPEIQWRRVLPRLGTENLSVVAQALADHAMSGLQRPREPEVCKKLFELQTQGILLPERGVLPQSSQSDFRNIITKHFSECWFELGDEMVMSSSNGDALVVCLADRAFSYIAGPTDFVLQITEHSRLECVIPPADTPLTWYRSST